MSFDRMTTDLYRGILGAAVEADAQALAFEGKKRVKSISGGKRCAMSNFCMMLYAYELDRSLSTTMRALKSRGNLCNGGHV
jgi:hypothetical protein